jgi:hypothetical protein
VRLPFALRGIAGYVDVSISENTDPDAVGYSLLLGRPMPDFIRRFPVCRARVLYPAEGYAAVFGWTQMVRSTDQGGEFEMDPIALYARVHTPFAWFGVKPEAFDAPSRQSLYDMVWKAHCFLCISPDAVLTPHVQAVCGFSWGFKVESGQVEFAQPGALTSDDWDSHLDLLRSSYPTWTFDAGYV